MPLKRKRPSAVADPFQTTPAASRLSPAEPQPSTSESAKVAAGESAEAAGAPANRRRRGQNKKLKTNELIAQLHTLRKQAALSSDPLVKQQLADQEAALGGLKAYQKASVRGSQQGGETSKWLVKTLISMLPSNRAQLKKQSLLDVGAIDGKAYTKWPFFKITSIDLEPQAEGVLKADWLETEPDTFNADPNSFDIVVLSLCLNFCGDLDKRSAMILHAHQFLKPDGKLYIVLPLACLNNSRYLTQKHLTKMLKSFGFGTVLKQHDSAKLSYWLVQRDGENAEWDGQAFPKQEVRPGLTRNNFAITIKQEE